MQYMSVGGGAVCSITLYWIKDKIYLISFMNKGEISFLQICFHASSTHLIWIMFFFSSVLYIMYFSVIHFVVKNKLNTHKQNKNYWYILTFIIYAEWLFNATLNNKSSFYPWFGHFPFDLGEWYSQYQHANSDTENYRSVWR